MTTAYVYIELDRVVRTRFVYEEGESQERLNSFSALDGWTITRDGEVVTIAKGPAVLDIPWGHTSGAIPFLALDGWTVRKGEDGQGALMRLGKIMAFRWAEASPAIRALAEPGATKPETPAAKGAGR